MPLPGYEILRGDRGPAVPALDDVSALFDVVVSERGEVGVPIDCRSWSQVRQRLGDHSAYSTLRHVEKYFAEGGSRAVLSRVVGPAARAATLDLRDSGGDPVVTVTALGPGQWGDEIEVTVTGDTGDRRVVTVTHGGATVLEVGVESAEELVDALAATGLVTGSLGVGDWPIVAHSARALAGGDDDRASITNREVIAALDVHTAELGPGTITASAWTDLEVHRALLQHAAARNRQARGNLPDTGNVSTLIAHATQLHALGAQLRRPIELIAGWPIIDVAGVQLPVEPSGPLCGREALTDAQSPAGPGQPSAWTFGTLATAVGVSQDWSEQDREALNDAGITVLVADRGEVFADDRIAAVDAASYPQYSQVAGLRVTMAIEHQCGLALRRRVQQMIDGRGHLLAEIESELAGICHAWFQRGALYGEAPEDAYRVDVGPGVNPPEELARRRVSALLELRPSPSARRVTLTITQVAAGDTI